MLKVENVNFAGVVGTCALTSPFSNYTMAYEVIVYPPKIPMPGAPYPVKFRYTIYDDKLNSVTGEYILEINSGTLPNNCDLGIPFGEYKSLARGNIYNKEFCLKFKLLTTGLEVHVY